MNYPQFLTQILDQESKKRRDPFDTGYWCNAEEGQIIYDLCVDREVSQYIEIGTCNGFSTCWAVAGMLEHSIPTVHTFDVENKLKVYEYFKELQHFKKYIYFNQGAFKGANALAPNHYSISTLYFIDGDHTQEGVAADWNNIHLMMGPNSAALFHDTNGENGVRNFWKKLERNIDRSKYTTINFDTARGMGLVIGGSE